jgi:hypothetical protein
VLPPCLENSNGMLPAAAKVSEQSYQKHALLGRSGRLAVLLPNAGCSILCSLVAVLRPPLSHHPGRNGSRPEHASLRHKRPSIACGKFYKVPPAFGGHSVTWTSRSCSESPILLERFLPRPPYVASTLQSDDVSRVDIRWGSENQKWPSL